MRNIQELSSQDYWDILRRRWLLLLPPFLLFGILGMIVVRQIPSIYVSQTLILVEPPKIPGEYVRSTAADSIESRLSTITQQIMSRTRLEKIIEDNDLYPEFRGKYPMDYVIEAMRKKIRLNVTRSTERRTDAFTLSFEAQDPRIAQKVVSQIASLYIEENLKVREEQTVGVSAFLDNELKETEVKLKEQEAKLGDFKLRNMGQLPEQEVANLAVLNRLQMQMQSSVDNVNRLQDQVKFQERMLEEYKMAAKNNVYLGILNSTISTPPPNPVAVELEIKRIQYDSMLKRYTTDHPDVRKLSSEISVLEEKLAREKGKTGQDSDKPAQKPANPYEAQIIQFKNQIDEMNAQVKRGLKDQEQIRRDMAVYQSKVDIIPRVEQMQKEISRDYESTSKHYQELLSKKNEAEMASSLEKRQKGEQFRILDPANLPEKPIKPNRLLLNLAGFAIGLVLGAGIALGLELMDESIHSERELMRLTGLPILASISMMGADGELVPAPSRSWNMLLPRRKQKTPRRSH